MLLDDGREWMAEVVLLVLGMAWLLLEAEDRRGVVVVVMVVPEWVWDCAWLL